MIWFDHVIPQTLWICPLLFWIEPSTYSPQPSCNPLSYDLRLKCYSYEKENKNLKFSGIIKRNPDILRILNSKYFTIRCSDMRLKTQTKSIEWFWALKNAMRWIEMGYWEVWRSLLFIGVSLRVFWTFLHQKKLPKSRI